MGTTLFAPIDDADVVRVRIILDARIPLESRVDRHVPRRIVCPVQVPTAQQQLVARRSPRRLPMDNAVLPRSEPDIEQPRES